MYNGRIDGCARSDASSLSRENIHPTAEELRAYCRALLADYKVPHSFDNVAALPLKPAGKVQKTLLKQQYAQNRKGGQRDERDRLLADETR